MPGSFFGGVHPKDHKYLTENQALELLPPSKTLVFPMSMHIGAPCTPTVKKGDTVLMGQTIGESPAPVSSPVHSSVSGTVTAVEPRIHPNGSMVLSVVVENDFADTPANELVPHADISDLSSEELTEIIRKAGIVGLGGAAFPTQIKISSGIGKVDTIIVNGAECEPYITSGYRGMIEYPAELIGGLNILMKVFGLDRSYIAIEDNKKSAVNILKDLVSEGSSGIEVVSLKTRYPQGAEKQLIQSITGRLVPPGQLPASVGCAVFNTDTVIAVYRAVYKGEVLTERSVTVAGSAIEKGRNLRVRIGTPFSEIFNYCGGFKESPNKVLMGGPMMGIAQFDLNAPVVKGTNALLAFCEDEDKPADTRVCIHCGRCISACPMKLLPMYMNMYSEKNMLDELQKLNILDCIECGSCAYICPGRLHLVQSFKSGKRRVQEKMKKEAAKK